MLRKLSNANRMRSTEAPTEKGMSFFTVEGLEEAAPARIIIDYYDNGYYLGLIPENDPGFQILFERQ